MYLGWSVSLVPVLEGAGSIPGWVFFLAVEQVYLHGTVRCVACRCAARVFGAGAHCSLAFSCVFGAGAHGSLLCCYFLRSRVRFCILALISADASITHATSSEQFKCTRSLACFFCAPRHFYSTPSLACLFLSCSSMADSVAGFDLNVRLEEPEDDDSVDEVHLDEPPLENESGKASVISFLLQTDLHLTTP